MEQSHTSQLLPGSRPAALPPVQSQQQPIAAQPSQPLVDTSFGLPSEAVYQRAEEQQRQRALLPRVEDIQPQPQAEVQPDRTLLGTAGDIGVAGLKTAVGFTQGLQGLANIPTGGKFGQLTKKLGYKPAETQEILSSMYSPAQQYASKQVREAKGFVPTIQKSLQYPSTILQTVGESSASMIGGMAAGKLLLSKAPTLVTALSGRLGMTAEAVAGAIGEGTISAGALAEGIREQTEDGNLSLGQSALALAGGLGTGIFSAVSGKLADKYDFADIDNLFLRSKTMEKPVKAAKAIVAGGLTEGLEEMPQEVVEQVVENAALDRPLMQGVPESAAQALLAGAAMGSGANIITSAAGQEPDTVRDDVAGQQQEPAVAPGAETEPQAAQAMFDMVADGLNTGQVDLADPGKAEMVSQLRGQLAEVYNHPDPEVRKVAEQNLDILEQIGVVEKPAEPAEPASAGLAGEPEITGTTGDFSAEPDEQQFDEQTALARAQAIQPKDRTKEEAQLVKDYQAKTDAEELAIRRARSLPDNLRTPKEREIVRAAEQREQEGYAKEELETRQTEAAQKETAEQQLSDTAPPVVPEQEAGGQRAVGRNSAAVRSTLKDFSKLSFEEGQAELQRILSKPDQERTEGEKYIAGVVKERLGTESHTGETTKSPEVEAIKGEQPVSEIAGSDQFQGQKGAKVAPEAGFREPQGELRPTGDLQARERQIRKKATELADEHPAHRSMTEAIKQGGINIDLAKREGWDADSLKDIRRPGLFSKNAVMGPDEMAKILGYETEEAMKNEWVKAPTKKELKASAEAEYTGQDLAIEESVSSLEKEGFDLGSEEKVSVGELSPGDEVVVVDRRGVPDKLTHKGYDSEGNALLQDGVLIKADPFEEIKILAKKTGDDATAEEVQGRFERIIQINDLEKLKAFQKSLPGEVKSNPKLKPYRAVIEGAITRRIEALKEGAQSDDSGRGAAPPQQPPVDTPEGGAGGGPKKRGRKELLEPITEKEDTPQLDTEKRTRYLGEQETRAARTESKRRQIGEAKKFQEERRDPKKHAPITEQRDYADKLPANTDRLMNLTAERYRAFNDAQASVDENKEHLVKLFDKAGKKSISVVVDGQKFTIKKPEPGKEQVIMNQAGRDALDNLKQKYKDAGLLTYDYDQGVTLMVQPAVAGKSKAAAYGPKTLEAAAIEHVGFMRDLAEARFAKDAARRRIKEQIIPELENNGIDHVWTNTAKDTVFWIRRSDAKFKIGQKERAEQYAEERKEITEGRKPEFVKRVEPGKLGSAGRDVSESKVLGLKKGEKAERQAQAEAELDQILKSISGDSPLANSEQANVRAELDRALGKRIVRRLMDIDKVFDIITPLQAAKIIAGKPDVDLQKSDNGRLEGFYHKKTGISYLIQGHLKKGQALGLLSHELGDHARHLGFKNSEAFKAILNRVEYLAKSGKDQEVLDAWNRAKKAKVSPEKMAEETLGYLQNAAPNHGIIKRLISAIKKFLIDKGKLSEYLIERLTVSDLQAMAQSAIRARAAEGVNEFAQSVSEWSATDPDIMKSYAGERAETANVKTLDEAKQMQEAGKDNEDIRQATGWFRGPDKKWRFEIDDNAVEFSSYIKNHPYVDKNIQYPIIDIRINNGKVLVSDVISHKELFEAYPDISKMEIIEHNDAEAGGIYYPDRNVVSIGKDSGEEFLSTLLHELQHAIQKKEGFAFGAIGTNLESKEQKRKNLIRGNEENLSFYLDDINYPAWKKEMVDRVRRKEINFDQFRIARNKYISESKYGDEIKSIEDELKTLTKYSAYEEYKNMAGEVEARDTAARRKMTKEQRKAAKPYESQGIAEEDMIVRFGEGVMMSMSAPAQEARRNTENLNATKDGQTSTTSAEAGNKAIRSIMATLRKIGKQAKEEVDKKNVAERKFVDDYRALLSEDTFQPDGWIPFLTSFTRQSDIPKETKARVARLIKQISSAKKPETQRKRFIKSLETLESDISKRLQTKIRNQVKRAAGPKREGVIKRGQYWHEQEKDLSDIRQIIYNMSAKQVEKAITASELRLDRLDANLKNAKDNETRDQMRKQQANAELRLHHLKTYGNLAGKGLDELLQAKLEAEHLRSMGRSKLRAIKKAWQQEIDQKTNWLAKEITGQDDPTPETAAQKQRRKQKEKTLIGKAKGAYSAVENSIQSWEHLLDVVALNSFYIDKNGKKKKRKIFQSRAVKELGSVAAAATDNNIIYNENSFNDIKSKGLEIFGVKKESALTKQLQKFSKKTGKIRVKGDTMQISPIEAAYLYSVRKEAGSAPVLKKMGYTEESFSDIEGIMTPELKAWADYLHGDLLAGVLQGETEAYRAVNGVDRTPVGLFREGQSDIPLMNLNTAISNRVYDANHYRAWAVPSKTFNDIFSVPEIRGYIEQHRGTSTLQALDRFLEDFAKSPKELRGDMAWMDKLRSNVVMSMIGLNPTTFFKQLTSMPAYAADIPTADFLKYTLYAMRHPLKVHKTIMSSPMARDRFGNSFDRDLRDADRATAEQVMSGKTMRAKDWLMIMTKIGDRAAIYAGYAVYMHNYKKAKRSKKTDKEAHAIGIQEFEAATRRTQQDASVMSLGSFQRGSSLQKLFTMYMTSPASYTRQTMAALRHFPSDPVGSSKRLLLFNVMLPMMFQAVASGLMMGSPGDEEWDEFWEKQLRAVALGPFFGVPIFRDVMSGAWDSMMGQWYGSDVSYSPVTETGKSLTQAVFHASKGLREFDEAAISRAKRDFLDFIGYLSGIPMKPGRRLAEGVQDVISGDTEHPFMATAGYSRAARDERWLGE